MADGAQNGSLLGPRAHAPFQGDDPFLDGDADLLGFALGPALEGLLDRLAELPGSAVTGATVNLFLTPLTPRTLRMALAASSFWRRVLTCPSRVTRPSDTVERMLGSGTKASHSRAKRTSFAISVSVRCRLPDSLIRTSSATSRTPTTRCAASLAASFLAQLSTLPVSVTIPSST